MSDLIIVGDEAWTREEWEAERERREKAREYQRRYSKTPEGRARRLAARQRWREQHPEYDREWQRRQRGTPGTLVGSLHDLACTGPTRPTGCKCMKVLCYREDAA